MELWGPQESVDMVVAQEEIGCKSRRAQALESTGNNPRGYQKDFR